MTQGKALFIAELISEKDRIVELLKIYELRKPKNGYDKPITMIEPRTIEWIERFFVTFGSRSATPQGSMTKTRAL